MCVVIRNVYVKNPHKFILKINKDKENKGTKYFNSLSPKFSDITLFQ